MTEAPQQPKGVGFLPRDAMGFDNDEGIEELLQDEARRRVRGVSWEVVVHMGCSTGNQITRGYPGICPSLGFLHDFTDQFERWIYASFLVH